MASVLADFVAHMTAESTEWEGPVEGRIVLGKEQLVLAKSKNERETISLRSVFDVNVGEKPKMFDPMPGTPVTIAYNDDKNRVAAVVATDEGTIRKFVTVLFKALLNGTEATLGTFDK